MPIIVDEVVISVEVGNQVTGGATTPPSSTEQKQIIVAEAVERVLEVLQQKSER